MHMLLTARILLRAAVFIVPISAIMTGDEIAKTREHRIGPKKLVPASGSTLDLLRGHMMRTECSLEALRIFGESVKESQTSMEASADNDTLTLSAEFYSALCYMFPVTEPLGIKPIKSCQPDTDAQNATACDKPTSEPKASSLYDFLRRSPDHSDLLHIPNENQTISERCKSYLDDYPEDRLSVLAHLIATPAVAVTRYDLPDYLADALTISIMDSKGSTIETSPASMLTREALLSTFLLFYLRDAAEHAMLAECVYTLVEDTTAQAQLFAESNAVPAVLEDAYRALLQCHAPLYSPFPQLPLRAMLSRHRVRLPVNSEMYAEATLHFNLLILVSALLYRPDKARYTICKSDKRPLATFFRSVRCPNEISLSEWQSWSQLIREVYPVPISAWCLKDMNLAMHHVTMICRALLNLPISDYTTANWLANETACAFEEAIRAIDPAATIRFNQNMSSTKRSLWERDLYSLIAIIVESPSLQTYPHISISIALYIFTDVMIVTDETTITETHKSMLLPQITLPSTLKHGFYTRILHTLQRMNPGRREVASANDSMLDIVFKWPNFDISPSLNTIFEHLLTNAKHPQPFLRALTKYAHARSLYISESCLIDTISCLSTMGFLFEYVPPNAIALWIAALHNARGSERARIRSLYNTKTSHWTDACGTACRKLMGLGRAEEKASGTDSGALFSSHSCKPTATPGMADLALDSFAQRPGSNYTFEEELAMHRACIIMRYIQWLARAKRPDLFLYFVERLDVLELLSVDPRADHDLQQELVILPSDRLRSILKKYAEVLTQRQQMNMLFLCITWPFEMYRHVLEIVQPTHLHLVRPLLLIRILFNCASITKIDKYEVLEFINVVRTLMSLEEDALKADQEDTYNSIVNVGDRAAAVVTAAKKRYVAEQCAERTGTARNSTHLRAWATARTVVAEIREQAELQKLHDRKMRAGILEGRDMFDKYIRLLLYCASYLSTTIPTPTIKLILQEVIGLYPELKGSGDRVLTDAEKKALLRECQIGAHRALKFIFEQKELKYA